MTRPDKPTTLHGYAHADALTETPRLRCGDCGAELAPADALYGCCSSCRDALVPARPERRQRVVLPTATTRKESLI